MTKIIGLGLGAVGLIGAGSYVLSTIKRRRAINAIDAELEAIDINDPIVVTDEVVIITEPAYVVEAEVMPAESAESAPTPGRGTGPR